MLQLSQCESSSRCTLIYIHSALDFRKQNLHTFISDWKHKKHISVFFFLIVRHNANIYTSTVATRYIKPYTQLNLEYIPPCNSYSHYTSNVWEDMILHLHLQHLLPILLIILGYAFFCFHTCIFIYWRSRCLTDCLSSVTLRWHH